MKAVVELVTRLVAGEVTASLRQFRLAAAGVMIIAALALAGIGFLVAAAYVAVARRYGAVTAGIWFGVGLLLLAAVTAWLVMRLERRVKAGRAKQRAAQTAAITSEALGLVPEMLRGKGGKEVIGAAALAALAYAIYREHVPRDDGSGEER